MDCSVCLWLIISFCWAWGASPGAVHTVFGALGKPTLLNVTPYLQNLTTRFEKVLWKRDTLDPVTKSIILDYAGGNYTIKLNQRIRFHPTNFSLEIMETSKQDEETYTFTGTQGAVEKVLSLRLEVYEEVSVPIIQVNKSLSNKSCTLTLNCMAEKGDNMTYCWSCPERHATWPCLHNGSLFNLSLGLWETSLTCVCTVSNPVSRYSTPINASAECSVELRGSYRLQVIYILPIILIMVICAGLVVWYWVGHRGQKQQVPLKDESTVHTIYAQVQRAEKQKAVCTFPSAEDHACTTIYACAMGLPPDTAQTQTLGPTTVYASVTYPRS
ncbi:PREDICTED: signaling lymphocytic activation molecule-like [Crocodylus porosus]|uniref:signaling lymphocytic activation molecule-like n=1 Tax=Crocodylus porosus TaxID=8502 RepID=UPI00093CDD8F|nr:PREDICTED: signaling lymphocytic activation molecule-like [Crocodylus porosus]